MSVVSREFTIGQSVTHPELGEGVVLAVSPTGYVTVFFRSEGQRQVPRVNLSAMLSHEQEIVANVRLADRVSLNKLGLMLEAEQIPLLSSVTDLTSAKIDLLPHQVVLTHRVAQAIPRRFLIADEVGLGKTIETALILRELASRGQIQRALMIVPAGLVENWRHELNDTFHLDFEVFGSEGDVTDRKSNAFAKHDRFIASIDTLKRPARVGRLLESPRYDLIVIDEAHHLTATRSGRKVSKTVNFKLAEALRDHTRDLLLLSATPHQGDHFRFWMLIRLLDPELFTSENDMVDNRHRLNSVVIRRTKADACARDGSSLFTRRQVHSNVFSLVDSERAFYEALRVYLTDGYNLAEAQGNAGRGLGFVMTIFQKLAASSFAAVRITLERRLLMLTLHEAMVCEKSLDVDGRDRALAEARMLLRQMYGLSDSYIDQAQVEHLLAEARLQLLKRFKQREEDELYSGWEGESKADNEEAAAELLVSLALPEERRRIRELLAQFPGGEESKAREVVRGLRAIWEVNPREKVVIFTTYLGSIAMLQRAITTTFPQVGVEILKGGDHGAKLAAERRFRHPNGPRVLLCTAAGREGINLQFAHVLFNADLPWNPMDLEQRIGRIHRYGQKLTAQVYN
ncbi:MAG: SNF2-related protein, partial [Ktedonobacteraceae bacterium]